MQSTYSGHERDPSKHASGDHQASPRSEGQSPHRKLQSTATAIEHDNTAVLEETLRLFVEATGKDEASVRQQLVNKRPVELLRDREFWKTRVEERHQEEFEEEFKRRVMTGYSSGSTEGREKYLDEWKIELQKKALSG